MENATVSMVMFELLQATQNNYITYATNKADVMSVQQNRQRPIEPFLIKLSANNESFDKVLAQMFKVDPF